MTDVGEDVDKWNLSALLVGMQTGPATVENSREVPQEIKSLSYDPAIPLVVIRLKETKSRY